MFDNMSHTRAYTFSWGFLQMWSTEVHLDYVMSHFSFKGFMSTSLQHVFWAYFHFTCLFIVHFHSMEDVFFLLFSHYFLIFHITSSYLFLSYQHQCIAFNFQPHNLKGIHDRLIHMLQIYNLFNHFHDNGCISINHVSWLCFKLWLSVFFTFIFVVSFTSGDT